MPDLDFEILGVDPAVRGLVPLLHFKLRIKNEPPNETIQSVILQAQIQIQAPQRSYNEDEKEKLFELFGSPEQWGQTLRGKLWTHANTTVRTFQGTTDAILSVPCSYDLNLAATKFFYGLEEGEVPLLFLFSGTIFYAGADGRLQVQQISWNKECSYRMPVQLWKELMEHHYPNSAWLYLERDLFERLCAFKRRSGAPNWEQAIERLLAQAEK
ncbi:MAG TPA: DUF6084 family protein [Chthoniobacterales bacterium]|jgi:hypothetical protein|nr:DUF6084 family protein [Chthoniobacterales bacterium]